MPGRRAQTRAKAVPEAAPPSPTDCARRNPTREAACAAESGSALELCPGLLPFRVVHAVVLAVAARGDRGLPELDRVEVGREPAEGVLLAGALVQLVAIWT